MSHIAIAALLKDRIGLEIASIGAVALERAVRERLSVSGIAEPGAYYDHLLKSAIELQELVETIVVPETWFFRDPEAFAALNRIANERRLRSRNTIVRVLSMPCSTGEEPYSIAMTLLDAGIAPEHFQIDAIDVSARAITQAQLGIYGRNSFRGRALNFRERHFDHVAGRHRLKDVVRNAVRFRRGNLFEVEQTVALGAYDVIFCRNLLIYFDRREQDRAVRILARLLEQDGVLFVGPSEAALFLDHGFISRRVPLAFAFNKPGTLTPRASAPITRAPRPLAAVPVRVVPAKRQVPSAPPASRPAATASPSESAAGPHWIEEAQRMADAGNVAEALRYCEQRANSEAPSAQPFYLMGLLHDAGGRAEQAKHCYRKALYLDPTHQEALVHLAVLLRGTGDPRGAQLLLDRARRVQQAQGAPRD